MEGGRLIEVLQYLKNFSSYAYENKYVLWSFLSFQIRFALQIKPLSKPWFVKVYSLITLKAFYGFRK